MHADAKADNIAQKKLARYAIVVLKEILFGMIDIRWTSSVYNGYPGGCAVPNSQLSATSSPLSPPGTDGISVL